MTWMVTGGAGYIGAHVARALKNAGMDAVIVDDLSSGMLRFVPEGVPFVQANILDKGALMEAMNSHGVTGVIHVAGFKYAGVSVDRPLHTYTQNVTGTVALLQAMQECQIDQIVFSSSAAVYGTPNVEQVTESTPKDPLSP
jgi:UDP-glucose 4-epimerase